MKIISFNCTIEPSRYLYPNGADLLLKITLKTDTEVYKDQRIIQENHLFSHYDLIMRETTKILKEYLSKKLAES